MLLRALIALGLCVIACTDCTRTRPFLIIAHKMSVWCTRNMLAGAYNNS